ncbi:MAG: hypothetical protein EA422_16030 [Gemmatimonadales bacterium]|nr:MAG: hypothetical protein EA422_16030 [Gemmatimonadales bacterium]
MEIARPGLLLAGALAALVPLALHLLRPRERDRRVLPTARFLSPESRTRIRVHTRPDHLLLLALRMGLCLILGAALAGLRWTGPSEGVGEIVIVDRGPGMAEGWRQVETLVVEELHPGTRIVVLVGVDEDGRVVSRGYAPHDLPRGEAWMSLAPGRDAHEGSGADLSLPQLLRELRGAGGSLTGVDSLRARIVTRPRWEAWRPGTHELRSTLWPGAIQLSALPGDAVPRPEARTDGAPAIRLVAPDHLAAPFQAALEVWGFPVETGPAPVELRVGSPLELGSPWAEAGADSDHGGSGSSPEDDGGAFLLSDGRVLPGAGLILPGSPAAGTRIPLLRTGGRPAAAALPAGADEPCRIALPLDGEAPILGSPDLPVLVDVLLREGCGVQRVGVGGEGAEAVWRELLEGGERPPQVAAEALRTREAGWPLTRLLLALALLVAIAEVLRIRVLDRGRVQG